MKLVNTTLSKLEPDVGPPYHFPDALEKLGPGEINRPLPWKNLTDEQRRFQATKMAIHAAMVDRMDREIGRLIEQLKAMGVFDNTLICFASDNGDDKVLLQTSMRRRTGQFDQPSLLYASKPENLQ